ncbi:uncharacterized protein LOC124812108 [Hydra vulgaris]|uniref:uncharacterized protein LOC124812108 n=1 Tax=Hydra vulgaris TaxID=6087 RepID=UPI001F5E9E4B|nr:uncharacterized protein LOC124812108 [Hydra vulgaris]
MTLTFFLYASILHALIAQELSLFPLKQYMENISVINTSMFLCHHHGSDLKLCNCDGTCFASKTCCIDKLWNNTNPLPLDIYLETLVNKSSSYKDMVCEKIISVPADSGHESSEILMVHSCQDGAETELVKLCLNSYEFHYANNVPVKGSDNVMYRNAACARCNFAEPIAINLSFECLLEPQQKKIQINVTSLEVNWIFQQYKNCTVSLNKKIETSEHISSCFSHVIQHCPTSSKHYPLCKAYSGTFLNYKNYDCFKCFKSDTVVSNQNTTTSQLSYIPIWLNYSFPLFHDTLEWINYTKNWFNYTTAWFNDKKEWLKYTSVLFNYTQSWFNHSTVWFNITPVWFNFTPEWVSKTTLWSNYNLFFKNNKIEWFNCTETTEFFDCTKGMFNNSLMYFSNITIVNSTESIEKKIKPIADKSFISNTLSFKQTIQINCGTGLYYSEVTKTCILITCCCGYTLVGSKCIDLQQNLPLIAINNASFENCLFSKKPGFYVISKSFQSLRYMYHILPDAVCFIIKDEILSNSTLLQCNMSVTAMKSLTNNKTIFHSISSDSSIFYITSVYNQLNTELYNFNIGRSFTQNKLCAQLMEFTYMEGNFTSSCDYMTENKTTKNEDLALWIEIHDNEIKRKMSICKRFHLTSNCILRNLTNNYKIENQTLTYTYLNKEYRFNTNEFVPLNKGVGVCESSLLLKLKDKNILDNAENLLSVILLFVSMGCYLFIFTTYILFKELRVRSNLNLITLCAFLILSDFSIFLAIFESKQKNTCKYISIILHWSLLGGYSLVLCMAIELALKFWRFAPKSFGRTNSFIATIFVSLMVPTLIVSINLSFDLTGTGYIGYGANNICWIGGFYARIFSYILPLCIILVSSVLCLVLTIFNITKLESANKKTLGEGKTSRVNLVMITMKLALILGVTDALGFFQISKPFLSEWEILFNSVFSIIYTCCRSSKGIMLFFVYICNKKIFRVYKRFTAKTIIKWRKSLQNTIVIKETSGFTESTF